MLVSPNIRMWKDVFPKKVKPILKKWMKDSSFTFHFFFFGYDELLLVFRRVIGVVRPREVGFLDKSVPLAMFVLAQYQ